MPRKFVFPIRPVLVLLFAGIAALGSALARQDTASPPQPAHAPAPTPLELQAGFTVTPTYSSKAMDTLVTRKETVIVVGYLTGFAKPDTPKKLVAQGQVSLGQIKVEIAPGKTAVFGPIKLDQTMLKWVDDQGPQLLINVYSGRKSSPNNLLDCGIYDGPIQPILGTKIPISCKLIGE